MYNGCIFPSLPISTLYGTVITTLFDNLFRFAFIVEWLELKLMKLIFTISMSVSCSWSSPCSILWTVLFLELLYTSWSGSSYCTFHTSFHMLGIVTGLWSWLQYLHLLLVGIVTGVASFVSLCLPSSFCCIASKFFTSCKLLMTAAWALWASILFAQINTCSVCIIILSSLQWALLWFLLAFLSHSAHVWTVILIAYLLLYNAFSGCCPKPTHLLFRAFILMYG